MVYRPCIPNDHLGVSTVHSQQWDIMEERNIDHINIRVKMIKNITDFVSDLISKKMT